MATTMTPNRRMAALTTRLGLRYLSLYEAFVSHRDAHDLRPHMSRDGHWSPLGHEVAAQAIGQSARRGAGQRTLNSLAIR